MPHCSSAKCSQIATLQSQIDSLRLRFDSFLDVFEDKVEVMAAKVVFQNLSQAEHERTALVYQDHKFYDGAAPESRVVSENACLGGVDSEVAAKSPHIVGCSSGVASESPLVRKLITPAVVDACWALCRACR